MSMLSHVNNVCKSAFYHLLTISRIRKYLSTQTTEILIHAFITSKLNHCNSLLYNVRKNVIKKASIGTEYSCQTDHTRDHITPILLHLYWLPVSEWMKFTILLLTFKALHQQSATHIQDLVTRYLPSRSLRSSSMLSLNPVSFNLKNYRSRAFPVSAPKIGTNYLTTYAHARISVFSSINLKSTFLRTFT